MSSQPKSDLFRQQAIDYHFGEPESSGVTSTRPRWTVPMIITSVVLGAATLVYVVVADELMHALVERFFR